MSTAGKALRNASHYEVLGLIGQGGMGSVYKARDRRLDRLVALKFLSSGLLGSAAAREMFQREAQAIAALNHPNIAVLFDVGESDDTPYLALEYLGGGSLEQRGANRRLPVREILDYALQLASGLSHAHGHGIIHRDVKPSNALFADTGILKLVDFGLAQWRGSAGGESQQSPGGTPQYMAPELLAGREIDQRCDVFAFGVLLYRLAAGRLPFDGPKMEDVVKRISREPPVPLDLIRQDLPKAYLELVDNCLEKQATRRPGSMSLVRHELERIEPEGESLQVTGRESWDSPTVPGDLTTTPMPSLHTPVAPRFRHWWAAIAAAVAVLVMLVAVAVRQFRRPAVLPGGEKLVVVLPFDCKTPDAGAAGFCGGLQADLLPRLIQTRQFQTGFWTVSAAELGSMGIRSAQQAGDRLHADLAIQGVVTFAGGEYRVHLDLTDAHDARLLRSRVVASRDTLALPGLLLSAALDLLETKLAATSTFSLAAAPTSVPESYQLAVQAQGLLLEYEGLETIRRADALLVRAIALDPNNALAHALRSQAWYQEFTQARDPESLRRAAQSADTAHRLKPGDLQVELAYGRALRAKGDYAAAIETFQRAVQLSPSDPEPLRLLALTYTDGRDDASALEAYRQAMALNPRWWPAWHNRGVYWARKGDNAKAIADLETARGLAPGNADILRDLGIYYDRAGRAGDAERSLRQSLDLRRTPRAYAALAYIRERQSRPAEAAALLAEAVQLSPRDHLLYYNLASAWSLVPDRTGEMREACSQTIALGTAYLKESPQDADCRARVAVCAARLGRSSQARSDINEALRLQPDSISVLKKAALVAVLQARNSDASESLIQAVRAGEDPAEILRDGAFQALTADPAFRQRLNAVHANK